MKPNSTSVGEGDKMQQTLNSTVDVVAESEWENYETDQELSEDIADDIWFQVSRQMHHKGVVFYVRRLAVAASVVFALLAAGYFWPGKQAANNLVNTKPQAAPIAYANITDSTIQVSLPDGSIVWLLPKTSIYTTANFAQLRQVTLTGEAKFKVQEDSLHPFMVKADAIETIVLGTVFTIQARADKPDIKVMLHKGKIAVRQINGQSFTKGKAKYILAPGDVFTYNKLSHAGLLSKQKPLSVVHSVPRNNKYTPAETLQGNNWYMFNNQSLAEVLDQLELIYQTPIDYAKADIKGMTFIGKIDKSDTLAKILHAIATLNQLQVVKQGQGYTIKK